MPDRKEATDDPQHTTAGIRVEGDLYALFRPLLNIPPEQRRLCPQCKHDTWIDTRWCRWCGLDFERRARPRCHPVKLLWISLTVNALLAAWVACLLRG